jgi:hypothetical protein
MQPSLGGWTLHVVPKLALRSAIAACHCGACKNAVMGAYTHVFATRVHGPPEVQSHKLKLTNGRAAFKWGQLLISAKNMPL